MHFENPSVPSHEEADTVLRSALKMRAAPGEAFDALVGLALADEDQAFVEGWCIRIAGDAADPALKGTAGLCVGHLARRFGAVSPEAAATLRRLAGDSEVVSANPQALDALADLDTFAPGS